MPSDNRISQKDSGGMAFPGYGMSTGMTYRQWLAGQAMQALLIRNEFAATRTDILTRDAFIYADAMIEEGKK